MSTSILAALCAVLAGGGGSERASGYDAAFVGMKVPGTVAACEVFPVAITMRNTGTKPWEGSPIRLREQHGKTRIVEFTLNLIFVGRRKRHDFPQTFPYDRYRMPKQPVASPGKLQSGVFP